MSTMTRVGANPFLVDEPAKVTRPIREQYTVAEGELLEFRHEARRAGMTIVSSSPVGAGYAITVEVAR